jgi:hypothetical protein
MSRRNRPYKLLSEVQTQQTEWLWLDWLPRGELTTCEGDPGVNKSTLTLDLAARVSSGRGMPTGATSEGDCKVAEAQAPGGVVLLGVEDSLTKTVRPRLVAAGADLGRIAVIEDTISLPDDLEVVGRAVAAVRARLVVIDPVVAFLGRNANNDQAVRRALTPLRRLAERAGAAVLLVRHLNKKPGNHALYRGSGSIGIVGAVRTAMLVGRDPEEPNLRVVAQFKNNLGPHPISLRFEPVSTGGVVTVEWRGESPLSAGDLLSQPSSPAARLFEAQQLLLDLLRDGPVEQRRIRAAAVDEGIAVRTLERAKELLEVQSARRGFGPGSVCYWQLAASPPVALPIRLHTKEPDDNGHAS